jgi:hypothetical protein
MNSCFQNREPSSCCPLIYYTIITNSLVNIAVLTMDDPLPYAKAFPRFPALLRSAKTVTYPHASMFFFSGRQRSLDCPLKIFQSKGFEEDTDFFVPFLVSPMLHLFL